jgi:UDP-N-acetylglucosamine 1-carboxyvinyltransferase
MVVGAIASQQSVTQHLNVKGGQRLQGTLTVSGAKNSALVLMTASLLTDEKGRASQCS